MRDLGKMPTVTVKSNTYTQIYAALEELLGNPRFDHDVEVEALEEVSKAIDLVSQSGKPVELQPRSARLRRVQHQLVESKRYASESVGEDPQRRLRILPTRL